MVEMASRNSRMGVFWRGCGAEGDNSARPRGAVVGFAHLCLLLVLFMTWLLILLWLWSVIASCSYPAITSLYAILDGQGTAWRLLEMDFLLITLRPLTVVACQRSSPVHTKTIPTAKREVHQATPTIAASFPPDDAVWLPVMFP